MHTQEKETLQSRVQSLEAQLDQLYREKLFMEEEASRSQQSILAQLDERETKLRNAEISEGKAVRQKQVRNIYHFLFSFSS